MSHRNKFAPLQISDGFSSRFGRRRPLLDSKLGRWTWGLEAAVFTRHGLRLRSWAVKSTRSEFKRLRAVLPRNIQTFAGCKKLQPKTNQTCGAEEILTLAHYKQDKPISLVREPKVPKEVMACNRLS